jgi:hypothetical protein
VRISSGRTGFVAAWLVGFAGTAVPTTDVILRSSPSLTAKNLETITARARVTVLATAKDAAFRVWLNVKTSAGHKGWVAAWLMRP